MVKKDITYEKHPREYTVVGATAIFKPMTEQLFIDFYGGPLSEIISVVENGCYYHYQIEGERNELAKKFLQRVNNNEVDLDKEYEQFDNLVSEYEKFLKQDESDFTKNTVLQLFDYYAKLIGVALACIDPIEVIDELAEDKQQHFIAWAQKTRRREEVIYKNGEMKFMPKYLEWFAKTQTNGYKASDLWYLLCTEMESFVLGKADLPDKKELEMRKKMLYVRQTPIGTIEYQIGDEAKKQITYKELNKALSDNFDTIKEITGTIAFKGQARGIARIIRTTDDMNDFNDNEIIITSMTDPRYLPIMKKAGAFVTNEGGMLSHAAIVARELEKPCIIGTKYATHVFKDGEKIIVDAEKGIIKRMV